MSWTLNLLYFPSAPSLLLADVFFHVHVLTLGCVSGGGGGAEVGR